MLIHVCVFYSEDAKAVERIFTDAQIQIVIRKVGSYKGVSVML